MSANEEFLARCARASERYAEQQREIAERQQEIAFWWSKLEKLCRKNWLTIVNNDDGTLSVHRRDGTTVHRAGPEELIRVLMFDD